MRANLLLTIVLLGCNGGLTADEGPKTTDVPTDGTPTQTDPTDTTTTTTTTTTTAPVDADGDGDLSDTDCDDSDATVYTGADEVVADGIDQDCDGVDDCFQDNDGDGVGGVLSGPGVDLTCTNAGEALTDDDCDDTDAARWPGNRDWCDGIDNDCDLMADPHCYQLANADTLWDTPFGGFTAYPLDIAAGDFDHDGVDELAIGTILSDSVYVSDGTPPLGQADFIDSTMTQIVGAEIVDCFGCTVDAGDADGDGYDDLLVGAPFVQHVPGVTNGSLYLFTDLSGVPAVSGVQHAAAEIEGDPTVSGIGVWQAGIIGDFNDDGVGDVMSGIVDEYNPTSRHWLVSGPFTGTLQAVDAYATVEEGSTNASYAYTSATADFDNDGIDDILVTSISNDAAYIFHGPITGAVDPSMADATFRGATGDELGTVATTGDYDGDGNIDVAIGGEGAFGGTGVLYVAHGPFSGTTDLTTNASFTMTAGTAWPRLGDLESKIASHDVDGDGTDDLLVGAPGHDPGGVLGVVFGPNLDGSFGDFAIDKSDMLFTGNAGQTDLMGMNVEWADLDGDGRDDLIVGAYLIGQVGVWYGPTLFP